MKQITLSADEAVIEQAQLAARSENKTLDQAFQEWLARYAERAGSPAEYDETMTRLRQHFSIDRQYTRDEMNER